MEQKKTTGSETSPLANETDALEDFEKEAFLGAAMLLTTYETLAMRTAKDFGNQRENLMHAAMGLCSDAGEACDVIKAHTIYGKDLDVEHLIEELGDSLWFIVLGARTAGVTLEQIARSNIRKLAKRYPDKYSDTLAVARLDKAS